MQTGPERKHDWHSMVMHKCKESMEVKEKFLDGYAELIGELSGKMAARFEHGHQLWVMGNGGSACDAQHIAVEFVHPIIEKRRALQAFHLVSEMAVLTAIANDKDYARIFADQIELHGKPGDMALAISTSGNSPNLIYALETAKRKEMLTIAFPARMADDLRERLSIALRYQATARIASHVTLLHILWDLIHVSMGEEDVT